MQRFLLTFFPVFLLILAAFAVTATPVAAAPLLAEGDAFNPPNWFGGGMAALALILPVAIWFWLRRRNYP